jgi:hypothetical protein
MSLSPIHHLLLLCLRRDGAGVEGARLQECSGEEWEALLRLAAQQRVSPLLYERLVVHGGGGALPGEVGQTLRSLYQRNSVRNMTVFHELGQMARLFEARGIPLLLLKGAHLALAVYESPAGRVMGDVDCLVPLDRIGEIAPLMEALGYEPRREFQPEADLDAQHHMPRFTNPATKVMVEVHWAITPSHRRHYVDVKELWERAVTLRLPGGVEVLGLAAEDLLLHLCMHATLQHQLMAGLRPLCDIAQVIARAGEGLRWNLVAERAERWGWERGVYLALYLARELLGAAVPDEVLRRLQPQGVNEGLVMAAKEILFTEGERFSALSSNLASVRHGENARERAAVFLQRLFLPRTVLASLYAVPPRSPRLYLYYLVRLKDLLLRYSPATVLSMGGDAETRRLTERVYQVTRWLSNGRDEG